MKLKVDQQGAALYLTVEELGRTGGTGLAEALDCGECGARARGAQGESRG